MSFEKLNQTLTGDGAGLAVFDPRLADITGLAQEGQFTEAVTAIDEVMAEDIYDVRLLGFYTYGVFLDVGLEALSEGFVALERCLTENWAVFGPAKNKNKHAGDGFLWLFKQVEKTLTRQESTRSALFLGWQQNMTTEQVGAISTALAEFSAAVDFTLEDDAKRVIEGISKVAEWLKAFERSIHVEPEQAPEPEALEEAAPAAAATQPSSGGPSGGALAIEGSVHLRILLAKLSAFEQLCARDDFSRAAIVADDLVTILGEFDPKKYFPSTFSNFFRLLAQHVLPFDEHFQGKEGVEWQAMQDFYQVDLEGFLGLENPE